MMFSTEVHLDLAAGLPIQDLCPEFAAAQRLSGDQILEIGDCREHAGLAASVWLIGSCPVVFYAGVAIGTQGKQPYGTLYVTSDKVSSLSNEQRQTLLTVARLMGRAIERDVGQQGVPRGIGTPNLERILNALPHLVSMIDRDMRYTYANSAYEPWFGLKPELAIGKTVAEVIGTTAFGEIKGFFERVLAGEVVTFEQAISYPSGDPRHVQVNYTPQFDQDGKVEAILAVVQDVSSVRRLEALQRHTTEKLQTAYDYSPVGLIELDDDLKIIGASPAFCAMLEFSEAELVGRSMYELAHPDDLTAPGRIRAATTQRGSVMRVEKRYLTKSGRVVWGSVAARSIPPTERGEKRFFSTVEDVSAVKVAELSRERTDNMLQAVLDGSPDLITVRSIDGAYLDINREAVAFYGVGMAELKGFSGALLPAKALVAKDYETLERGHFHGVHTDDVIRHFEHKIVLDSGKEVYLDTVMAPVKGRSGITFAILTVSRNVTDIKTADVRLLQSRKMAALGEMAGGVAHEINNPLAIIVGKSSQARRQLERLSSPEVVKALVNLSVIEATGQRIAKIIRGLQTFSRDATDDPKVLTSVSEMVNDALALCQERFRHHGIELRVADSGDTAVMCRPTQIVQVLINLLTNAHDAVNEMPTPWVEIKVWVEAKALVVAVTDSGPGIAATIVEKLMQPFFTTKGVGKGTGLGLSISKGIAEEHGGQLYYDHAAEHTRFILRLPTDRKEKVGDAA